MKAKKGEGAESAKKIRVVVLLHGPMQQQHEGVAAAAGGVG